ncbi:MAG: hypothetical protein JXR97_15640 [Planctomycetes bacterium]|nr:hypothetical protein [Planctomycetota bacterium]
MQNFPKISALILIVGLVGSFLISKEMRQRRVDQYHIGSEARQEMVYMPYVGFDKFAADIKWMQTINYLGKVKGKMTDNELDFFNKQFQRITDLDPDFVPVYKIGAGHIAYHKDAQLALDLIDKAGKYSASKDYEIPYQAAHWIIQIRARNATTDDERKKHYDLAISYLNKALEGDNPPWFVENMLLHTIAKKNGDYGDSYREVQAWNNYYWKRVNEMKRADAAIDAKEKAEGNDKAKDAAAVKKAPGEGEPEVPEYEMAQESSDSMNRLRNRIVERCRELMATYLGEKKAGKAPADVEKRVSVVKGIFRKINNDTNFSPVSLAAYDAGDMYDHVSGTAVVPFGIDLYDYEVNGRITPVKGDFNTLTGKPVAKDFEALKKLLGGKGIERLKDQYELYQKEMKDNK